MLQFVFEFCHLACFGHNDKFVVEDLLIYFIYLFIFVLELFYVVVCYLFRLFQCLGVKLLQKVLHFVEF